MSHRLFRILIAGIALTSASWAAAQAGDVSIGGSAATGSDAETPDARAQTAHEPGVEERDQNQHDASRHDASRHDAGKQDAGKHDAGEHDASRHTPRQLDLVQVTASRRRESLLDVPMAVTVVDADTLHDASMQTPMDALHGAVGTYVQQTTPGQGVVIVRGLKGSEVLHLVDGFRLNNAIFRNAPNQYIALVDGQSLDRIEVVRGPSGTLYGGDAMGGVVQMLTPALRYAENGGRQWHGALRTVLASADDAAIARGELSGGGERHAFALGYTAQNIGDLRVGDGDTLPFTAFRARFGDLKFGLRPAPGHTLQLSVQAAEQPRTPRHDALVPGFGQTVPENAVFFFEPQRRRFAQLVWAIGGDDADGDGDASPGNVLFDAAELRIGRQVVDDDRRTVAFGSRSEDRERNRDTTDGVAGQFTRALGGGHTISYGVEWYRDRVASSRLRTQLDTGAVSQRAPRFPDGARMDSQAVYLVDDWRLGRFDIEGGLRYSRFDVRIPASADVPGVRLRPDDLTGHLGASFAASDALRVIANLGRGFRAPNIFDLGVFGPRPGNRWSEPNPQLEPETVTSMDVGLKYADMRWTGELIAFRARYRDKIAAALTGELRPDGALVVQNRNLTRLDLRGVEAGLRWRGERVDAYATATWTRGDESMDGTRDPADRIPPLFGRAGAVWHGDALTLEAYSLYAGAQKRLSPRDRVDPRIDPRGTAGWATFNLRLEWRVVDRLSLALRGENLGDRRYREHGSGLDEPGRNLILTADYRY